jgi:hypothetical protein
MSIVESSEQSVLTDYGAYINSSEDYLHIKISPLAATLISLRRNYGNQLDFNLIDEVVLKNQGRIEDATEVLEKLATNPPTAEEGGNGFLKKFRNNLDSRKQTDKNSEITSKIDQFAGFLGKKVSGMFKPKKKSPPIEPNHKSTLDTHRRSSSMASYGSDISILQYSGDLSQHPLARAYSSSTEEVEDVYLPDTSLIPPIEEYPPPSPEASERMDSLCAQELAIDKVGDWFLDDGYKDDESPSKSFIHSAGVQVHDISG